MDRQVVLKATQAHRSCVDSPQGKMERVPDSICFCVNSSCGLVTLYLVFNDCLGLWGFGVGTVISISRAFQVQTHWALCVFVFMLGETLMGAWILVAYVTVSNNNLVNASFMVNEGHPEKFRTEANLANFFVFIFTVHSECDLWFSVPRL